MDDDTERADQGDAVVLAELEAATSRLLAAAGQLDDAGARGPSALPDWSRGHVLTHLARNADGLVNLLTWAETGIPTPMYASAEARAADIEAGAGRPAAELMTDLSSSAARLAERLRKMPVHAASVEVAMVSGASAYAWEIPLIRIREVELHLVDLAVGVTVLEWSDAFCVRSLDQIAPGVAARDQSAVGHLEARGGDTWTLGSGDGTLRGPVQELLGWLTGRSAGTGLEPVGLPAVPAPPPWG